MTTNRNVHTALRARDPPDRSTRSRVANTDTPGMNQLGCLILGVILGGVLVIWLLVKAVHGLF